MQRRRGRIRAGIIVLLMGVLARVSLAGPPSASRPVDRPNVVFILTDDQNNDTIGCFGGKVLTPHLDGLASRGVRFTRAYSVSSVCTPSRYICLTGQYASRCQSPRFLSQCPPGTQANVGFNVQISADTPNLARTLQEAGYRTGFVGKWHTGTPNLLRIPQDADLADPDVIKQLQANQERMCAMIRSTGFDYAASVYKGNLADHNLDGLTAHNQEWVTRGALDFLDQYGKEPFFLHVCTTLQHSPPPNRSIAADPKLTPVGVLPEAPGAQAPRSTIAARLEAAGVAPSMGHATWLDDGVGAILAKLDELGVADNTLILVFSDNGTLRGKGTCYEGGVHTPALLVWKNHVTPGTTCAELVGNIDFAPTILEACGVAPPADLHMDGRSLVGLLAGGEAQWRDSLLLEIGHTRGVVTDRWKYFALRYPPALERQIEEGTLGRLPYHMDTSLDLQQTAERAHPGYRDADQLYDLASDPLETTNLAGDPTHGTTRARLEAALRQALAAQPRPFGELGP